MQNTLDIGIHAKKAIEKDSTRALVSLSLFFFFFFFKIIGEYSHIQKKGKKIAIFPPIRYQHFIYSNKKGFFSNPQVLEKRWEEEPAYMLMTSFTEAGRIETGEGGVGCLEEHVDSEYDTFLLLLWLRGLQGGQNGLIKHVLQSFLQSKITTIDWLLDQTTELTWVSAEHSTYLTALRSLAIFSPCSNTAITTASPIFWATAPASGKLWTLVTLCSMSRGGKSG